MNEFIYRIFAIIIGAIPRIYVSLILSLSPVILYIFYALISANEIYAMGTFFVTYHSTTVPRMLINVN